MSPKTKNVFFVFTKSAEKALLKTLVRVFLTTLSSSNLNLRFDRENDPFRVISIMTPVGVS